MDENTVEPYFSRTHLVPEQIYEMFQEYKLSSNELKCHGFPLDTPNHPGKVELTATSKFSKSFDPESQICRCGQRFNMLEDKWYVATNGCYYHPRKRSQAGLNAGLFECCNQNSYTGCTYSNYHVSSICQFRDIEFKKTEVTEPCVFNCMYALDCEMCFTTKGMEIVKVSLISVSGYVIYDTYVKPENKVLDYNTAFSGVTCKDLENVDTTLEDVQFFLMNHIGINSILIGHSLENDLLGLHIIHDKIIDTSVVFPHNKGFPYKNSLKSLALRYLGKTIQDSDQGHNSIEDARTCLELMLSKIIPRLPSYEWQVCVDPYNCMSSMCRNNRVQYLPPMIHRHLYTSNPAPSNQLLSYQAILSNYFHVAEQMQTY